MFSPVFVFLSISRIIKKKLLIKMFMEWWDIIHHHHHHHHHHQILLWRPSTGAQERLTTQTTIKRSIKYIKMKKVSGHNQR